MQMQVATRSRKSEASYLKGLLGITVQRLSCLGVTKWTLFSWLLFLRWFGNEHLGGDGGRGERREEGAGPPELSDSRITHLFLRRFECRTC